MPKDPWTYKKKKRSKKKVPAKVDNEMDNSTKDAYEKEALILVEKPSNSLLPAQKFGSSPQTCQSLVVKQEDIETEREDNGDSSSDSCDHSPTKASEDEGIMSTKGIESTNLQNVSKSLEGSIHVRNIRIKEELKDPGYEKYNSGREEINSNINQQHEPNLAYSSPLQEEFDKVSAPKTEISIKSEFLGNTHSSACISTATANCAVHGNKKAVKNNSDHEILSVKQEITEICSSNVVECDKQILNTIKREPANIQVDKYDDKVDDKSTNAVPNLRNCTSVESEQQSAHSKSLLDTSDALDSDSDDGGKFSTDSLKYVRFNIDYDTQNVDEFMHFIISNHHTPDSYELPYCEENPNINCFESESNTFISSSVQKCTSEKNINIPVVEEVNNSEIPSKPNDNSSSLPSIEIKKLIPTLQELHCSDVHSSLYSIPAITAAQEKISVPQFATSSSANVLTNEDLQNIEKSSSFFGSSFSIDSSESNNKLKIHHLPDINTSIQHNKTNLSEYVNKQHSEQTCNKTENLTKKAHLHLLNSSTSEAVHNDNQFMTGKANTEEISMDCEPPRKTMKLASKSNNISCQSPVSSDQTINSPDSALNMKQNASNPRKITAAQYINRNAALPCNMRDPRIRKIATASAVNVTQPLNTISHESVSPFTSTITAQLPHASVSPEMTFTHRQGASTNLNHFSQQSFSNAYRPVARIPPYTTQVLPIANSSIRPAVHINVQQDYVHQDPRIHATQLHHASVSSEKSFSHPQGVSNNSDSLSQQSSSAHRPEARKCDGAVKKTLVLCDLFFHIIRWRTNWLHVQKVTKKYPKPIAKCNEVKYNYQTSSEYQDTYHRLHLLNIWLCMYESWIRNPPSYKAQLKESEKKGHYCKNTCNAVMPSEDIPIHQGIIQVTCKNVDNEQQCLFGYVYDVRAREHSPPGGSHTTGSWKQVIFSFYTIDKLNIKIKDIVQICKLCKVRVAVKQYDALGAIEELPMREIILNPSNHLPEIVLVPLPSTYSQTELQKHYDKIIQCIKSPENRFILVQKTSTMNDLLPILKIVRGLVNTPSSLLICLRDIEKFFNLVDILNSSKYPGIVLGVKESEVKVPVPLQGLTLRSRAAKLSKMTLDKAELVVLHKSKLILTVLPSVFLSDSRTAALGSDLTCIIEDAHLCSEAETALPLSFKPDNVVLLGLEDEHREMDLAFSGLGYNKSLFHRLLKVKKDEVKIV